MQPTVHRLHMASLNQLHPWTMNHYAQDRTNVYAYLVISSSAILLIDSGVGENNRFIERRYEPRRSSMTDELARFDVKPEDITLLVNSHLHFDHCGNNNLFRNAEIYVQESELAIARTQAPAIRRVINQYSLKRPTALPLSLPRRRMWLTSISRGGDREQAHEGHEQQYLESLQRLKCLDVREVLFSHGNESLS